MARFDGDLFGILQLFLKQIHFCGFRFAGVLSWIVPFLMECNICCMGEMVLWGRKLAGFYVFTGRSARPTVSDGSIFRCTTKDRGERRAKGLRPPLDPRGNVLGHSDVLCANHFATVRVTRLSRLRRSAYPLASACCAAQKDSKTYATAQLPTTNLAGYSLGANEFATVRAVRTSPWKQCVARHGRA